MVLAIRWHARCQYPWGRFRHRELVPVPGGKYGNFDIIYGPSFADLPLLYRAPRAVWHACPTEYPCSSGADWWRHSDVIPDSHRQDIEEDIFYVTGALNVTSNMTLRIETGAILMGVARATPYHWPLVVQYAPYGDGTTPG